MHIKNILLFTLALCTAAATAFPHPLPGDGPQSDAIKEAIDALNVRYQSFIGQTILFNRALEKWRPYCNPVDKEKVAEYSEELEDIKHNAELMMEHAKRDIEEMDEGDDLEVKLAHALGPIKELGVQVFKMHAEFGGMITDRKLNGWDLRNED